MGHVEHRSQYPPGIHWTGGRVDTSADLDDKEKRKFLTLPGLELRQSLYRLGYRDSYPLEP
jgi:hypothetical protein